MKSKRNLLFVIATSALILFSGSPVGYSHCEIPCGIYDDAMRIEMIAEHITTIEKSMNEIHKLSKDKDKNYNQLVRWIVNKENHADDLSDIVTQYFMKQRVSPVEDDQGQEYKQYVHKVTLLHKLMVYSMKCKQTTDLDNVAKLKKYLGRFRSAYLGEKDTASDYEHKADHEHNADHEH
jgi:nickel superoxide dismutase